MLNIEHLTKIYGDKRAVDDLSLHIRPGEIYGFIGHNGAGKTTTIKACCGILRQDEGQIYVDGVSMRDDPIRCKSKLAYIPDNPDLYEFMTGIQFLNFVADIFGVGALCATGMCLFSAEEINELLGQDFMAMLARIKSGQAEAPTPRPALKK